MLEVFETAAWCQIVNLDHWYDVENNKGLCSNTALSGYPDTPDTPKIVVLLFLLDSCTCNCRWMWEELSSKEEEETSSVFLPLK